MEDPDVIVRSLSALAPGKLRPPINRQEWMRHVVSFSIDAARMNARKLNPKPDSGSRVRRWNSRYGTA